MVDLGGASSLDEVKETLIHEFVHLVHHRIVPGRPNKCITDLYNQMYESGHTGYWMTNTLEFFAEVATTYYGSSVDTYIASGREDLREKFPILHDMIYYMVDHLDEHWDLVNKHCNPDYSG